MKDGRCPHCEGREIYRQTEGAHWGGNSRLKLLRGGYRAAEHDAYVCARCGLLEVYVSDEDALAEVRSDWERV